MKTKVITTIMMMMFLTSVAFNMAPFQPVRADDGPMWWYDLEKKCVCWRADLAGYMNFKIDFDGDHLSGATSYRDWVLDYGTRALLGVYLSDPSWGVVYEWAFWIAEKAIGGPAAHIRLSVSGKSTEWFYYFVEDTTPPTDWIVCLQRSDGINPIPVTSTFWYSENGGATWNSFTPPQSVDKTLSKTDAYLGDRITVTLDVSCSTTLELRDTLLPCLQYIPDTFTVDGVPVVPTVVGNVISTSIAPGEWTVTFDIQVVEAPATAEMYTNLAELWDGPLRVAYDSEDIMINPYEGFSKEAVLIYDDDHDGIVEVGEEVDWTVTITVTNVVGDAIGTMSSITVEDRFGGELEIEGGPIKEPIASDYGIAYSGKTAKPSIKWWNFNLADGGSATLVLTVSTDINPAGKHSYTQPGTYEMNSGAVLKFIDPVTGFQLSAHRPPITVDVYSIP